MPSSSSLATTSKMPPIQQLEPPKGAEHLVGSIQEYLIRRFGIEAVPLLLNYRSNKDLVEYARLLGYPAKLQAAFPTPALPLFHPLPPSPKTLPPTLPSTPPH